MKTLKASLARFTSLSVLGVALSFSAAGTANAAFLSCVGDGYDISGKVSTATNCAILSPLNGAENDKLNPTLFVNDNSFFGISNWLFDGKWNSTNTGFVDSSGLFDFTGGGPSGTFSYEGPLAGISDIMFVFKDGAGTNLVGYLVTANDGTYSTPFTKPPFPLNGGSTFKDVSHVSVYYREGTPPSQIPEPGMLLLLGAGLVGLGLTRRRKAV